jgi:hypothetical protein
MKMQTNRTHTKRRKNMFKNLFNPQANDKEVEVNLDPRAPGIQGLPAEEINRWLDGNVEIIDLGDAKRDEMIQPTTWHAAG